MRRTDQAKTGQMHYSSGNQTIDVTYCAASKYHCIRYNPVLSTVLTMEIIITVASIFGFIAYISAAVVLILADPLWCVAIGAFMLSAMVTFGILLGQLVWHQKIENADETTEHGPLPKLILQTARSMFAKRNG